MATVLGAAVPPAAAFVFATATMPHDVLSDIKLEFPGVVLVKGPGLHRVAATLEPLGKLPKQHSGWVVAVALDGNLLVSGSLDQTAKLWSLSARAVTATLAEHTSGVYGVAVSDAAIATGSRDQTARLWSREGGASRHTLKHPSCVDGVAMAGDVLAALGALL